MTLNVTRFASLALLAVAAACSSIVIPPDRLERNEASMRAASEVGAANVPAAQLHLTMAHDETEAAKRLAAKGDDRAVLVLARAEADAELAVGLTHEAVTHAEAVRAAEELRALKTRTTP